MYNREVINSLIQFIVSKDGIANKSTLSVLVQNEFDLTKDRSVYYGQYFAIRFCQSKKPSSSFANTVLALSALQKYDDKPFIVCLVTPDRNYLMLANTSFLRKISHTSQELRTNNIKGSFLGTDIMLVYEGVVNAPVHFEYLFTSHENYTFEFDFFSTATDIKTKILFLSSNPKGYNIDKLLAFLAKEKSVYLIYVVAIDENKHISTRLCSMFNKQLLSNTRIMKQWAGRNSRGVTQYDGKALEAIVSNFDPSIDVIESKNFLIQCLDN